MATTFGKDVSCTDEMRSGRFASGLRLVAEACYRRLITPRGDLRGGDNEDNYGIDLTSLVGASNPKQVAAALPGRIQNELTKDERVVDVEVDIVQTVAGPSTSFVITILVETTEGPFSLTLAASDVTVSLLGIAAEAA